MRILTLIFLLLLFFSCNKDKNSVATTLIRTESTSYTGDVLNTEYGYDNRGRITTIRQYENNAQPVITVTINYNGNEATLLSHPQSDPVYNQTTEVHLMLDASGRMLKRIEYTHGVSKIPAVQPTEKFRYDTLLCEYNAAGFIMKTTGRWYDSSWVNPTYYSVRKISSTTSYTMDGGNLTASDEYAVYPVITFQGGITTVSGGSSEYHNLFRYTKSLPNKTDYKNAAVLNEYRNYYEPFLNSNYKNMPDQVVINNIDKDSNGSVIFTGNSTINIDRTYNNDGLLASIKILPGNTQYTAIKYFYGK